MSGSSFQPTTLPADESIGQGCSGYFHGEVATTAAENMAGPVLGDKTPGKIRTILGANRKRAGLVSGELRS